ncbi:hypothetical protein [Massilia sp. Mn16-1_5]|uniref:hypothetical protein n=1 Tax=Massilia sp. Mn16-1_5 TaxID=2079199 RepID=UPI00109EE0E9|nr:hypothetical protein [Massilia sp. Mn16-1_5]THC41184.1 hypothetical protein C2862_19640 [Massilia sp. Mn16-1_5]
MILAIGLIGVASVLLYLWRRRFLDALLALVASAALALLAVELTLPGESGGTLAIDPRNPPVSLAGVRSLSLTGDGLRAAQWADLPARPLAWNAPSTAALRLDFPRRLALGRLFTLTLDPGTEAERRLQLLAENGQLLAETRGSGKLALSWLPPLAETLVLKARLLDEKNSVLAEGPVPLAVSEARPLAVRGRFSAPSFDLRVLNDLLVQSRALVDWQVALGKTVTRSERAREHIEKPDLLVIDAAWFERAAAPARASLLEQVSQGAALLVLGVNANDAGVWSRSMQLPLQAQPADKLTAGPLALPVAPLAPGTRVAGAWTGQDNAVWARQWGKGRIGWLGAADWHRLAIAEPRALALWWQGVLDAVRVERAEEVQWLAPREMPLPGQRLEVCALGVRGKVRFPELNLVRDWQRRPDRADASCVAVYPRAPGWLRIETQGSQPTRAEVYVYAPQDWPQWQATERRDATARYAARTPAPAAATRRVLPLWPFALLFGLAMLGLWWRERR